MISYPALKPMSADPNQAGDVTRAAYALVKLYDKTDAYGAVVQWIDALITQQQAAFVTLPADKLPGAQKRLKQLIAMRDALCAPGGAFTGFLTD